ncbi:hypothetical protein ACFVTF_23025 [Kitasatospora sp. NPDC057940]|uniref:hypothetical protein n=1 Tax=Kitasatospora sp. NPDC057940 TaxID=3346285 RepID=UPI0036DD95BE
MLRAKSIAARKIDKKEEAMRKGKMILVAATLGAFCSLGVVVSPTAQASTPGVLTCDVIETGGPDAHAEGYADGRICDGNITGTVHDTKADGRCPYVRLHFNDGSSWDSPWAGGNGTKANFSGYHPGAYAWAELRSISC